MEVNIRPRLSHSNSFGNDAEKDTAGCRALDRKYIVIGSNKPYYHCLDVLKQLMDKREEQTSQVVFHTDQGAVYSSRAFCQAHKDYNILRSMSRVGTPTDNPIIEALNGWIKEELFLDFDLAHAKDVPALLDSYVDFFNNRRLAAALGYRSPVQYRTELGFC